MCSVFGKRAVDGRIEKLKREIPEIVISGVRRARLTDGPVQTTGFSPQELRLNLHMKVHNVEGKRVRDANGRGWKHSKGEL